MENELPRIADDSNHRVEWWLSSAGLENHFRSVADSIPALAALLRPTGEIELVNRQTLDYFGATLAQLQAGAIPDLIHPDDLLNAPRTLNDHTRDAFDYEVRLRRSDGVYRWFNTRAFPLRDPGGQVVLWYLLQTDLDDIKRADALLAGEKVVLEMVARGQSLTEVLDALCRLVELAIGGSYCCVRLVSPRGDRLLLPTAPSLPSSFAERIGGCALEVDSCPGAMAARRSEQLIVCDLARETRWEGTEWRSAALFHGLRACWSTPIASADKKVLGIVEILHEVPKSPTALDLSSLERFTNLASIIIERAQRENALRRSESFLAEAQRVSSTGSFSWRPATNEITWSEELYRMFEIDRVEPMTPELTDLRVHPEDLPLLYEKVNQARLDGRDFEFDYRLLMPDGSIKHMHTVFHRNQDADGQVEFIGAIQDVTQRRLYADALAKAQSDLAHVARVSTLGQLTASIAHEVSQPLAGIIMNASTCLRMLAADPPNVDGAQETARRTIRDAHRAADVVTRLRALFDKKSEGNEWVDLNEATREVIALSTRELQRDRVVLKLALANDLPRVRGDRVQLQQVILNLVLNACESMRGVGDVARELTITTERDERKHVRLSVRDAGMGFDEQATERMFEAFYTTKQDGMGIGLSVSRSIVESHRGRLWAAANDGPGASFSLSIPCEAVDGPIACTLDASPKPLRTDDLVQTARSLE